MTSGSVLALHSPRQARFDRNFELDFLKGFSKQPGKMLLFAGPPRFGKTELLKQLKQEEEKPGCVNLVDMLIPDNRNASELTRDVFKAKEGPNTLVIDEANRLCDLNVYDQNLVSSYLARVMKEGLASVILSTNDASLGLWLSNFFLQYETHMLGELPEREARHFFDMLLGQTSGDDMWMAVYAVCGGSPPLLQRGATYLQTNGVEYNSWVKFEQDVKNEAYLQLYAGMDPREFEPPELDGRRRPNRPSPWKGEDWFEVMKAMCKRDKGVLPWDDVVKLGGLDMATGLLRYNMVTFRVESPLGRDMSWYKGPWPVVTPVSRPSYLAMLEFAGDIVLDGMTWKLRQTAAPNSGTG